MVELTVNDSLMQLQADILGVHVVRPVVAETTALGGGIRCGISCWFLEKTLTRREATGKPTAIGNHAGAKTNERLVMHPGRKPSNVH